MRIIGSLLVICLLAGVQPAVAETSAEQWLRDNDAVTAMFESLSDSVHAGLASPIKCATPLLNAMIDARPKGMDAKSLYIGREDTMSFTHGTDHFLLHYTSTGANRPYQYDQQILVPGIPDYIVMSGRILDSIWNHTVGVLGFPAPVSDGYYNGGGDGRLDVYIIDVPAYGATVRDSVRPTLPITATTYMFLENDYLGFPGYEANRLNALRVAAAHEFFHSVQFGIDITEVDGSYPNQNPAWIEMSATFMEEEHYPLINDYFNYLPFFYKVPQWSVRTGTFLTSPQINAWRNLHMYASVVFPLFLKNQFGSGMLKAIWTECGQEAGPNWLPAIDAAVRAASGNTYTLGTAFQEFALWNLFTRQRTRAGEYFPDAISYDSVNLAARLTHYPITLSFADSIPSKDSIFPDNLGANYVMLENVAAIPSGLTLLFDCDTTISWGVTVVGLHNNINLPVSIQHILLDTMSSLIFIPNAAQYDRIALIASVLEGDGLKVPYSLSVGPVGEGVIQPNGGEELYAGSPYDIRWFYDTTVTSVLIEFSSDNGATWSDVATAENAFIYEWMVPNSPSDSCLIRVSDVTPGGPSDTSDNVFSIRSTGVTRVWDPFPNPAWVEKHEAVYFKGEYPMTQLHPSVEMSVTVMTLAGEKVWEGMESSPAGAVIIPWKFINADGQTVAAGPYLAVIKFQGETYVRKFVVLR